MIHTGKHLKRCELLYRKCHWNHYVPMPEMLSTLPGTQWARHARSLLSLTHALVHRNPGLRRRCIMRMASTVFYQHTCSFDKDFGNASREEMIKISNCLVKMYQAKPWVALGDISENQGQQFTKGIHSFNTQLYKHLCQDRHKLVSERHQTAYTHQKGRNL